MHNSRARARYESGIEISDDATGGFDAETIEGLEGSQRTKRTTG
jgi:hypothetical protein